MLEKTKEMIKMKLASTKVDVEIDLSQESLSIQDYLWLAEIISKSSYVKSLILPEIQKEDADEILSILDKVTVNNSVLSRMNIMLSGYDEQYPANVALKIHQIQSRLQRNSQKIFGIHGGGNIGLGLMADIISTSSVGYRVLATTQNQFKADMINGNNNFLLKHDSTADPKTTCVSHVEMILGDRDGVHRLYEDACLVAVCVTPSVLPEIAEDIASAMIRRYNKDGSGLKLLILMNIPNCASFVQNAVMKHLVELTRNELEASAVLAGIEFIPTVIDRIVTPIQESDVKVQLKLQLEKIDTSQLSASLGETQLDSIMTSPTLLRKAVASFNLRFALFNAEKDFSIYVHASFIEARKFRFIRIATNLKSLEELKNKFINGPHTILAWLGALKGYTKIAQAVNDRDIFIFIKELMRNEIKPILTAAYPDLSSEDFDIQEELFFERCRVNYDDKIKRVGRDPMRKLDSQGRIRGTIELSQAHTRTFATKRLQLGIAAGMLYGIGDYDPENPGCQKIKQIYTESNHSFSPILCYRGPAPSGTFTGFHPVNDKMIIQNIEKYIEKMTLGSTNPVQLVREPEAQSLESGVSFLTSAVKTGMISLMSGPVLWRKPVVMSDSDVCRKLNHLGIKLDQDGHLFYADQFRPVTLNYQLVFIRHGETFGNCGQSTKDGKVDYFLVTHNQKDHEKRIFQGNVDSEINQLTERGKLQAQEVASKLKVEYLDKEWIPDIILHSPLRRAIDTAMPFVENHQFEDKFMVHKGIVEMSFGVWENQRVCDLPQDDPCHLFYREQHAYVKSDSVSDSSGHKPENFGEVLLRAHSVLMDLNVMHAGKKIIMFSHSMFGAACCILLGRGQKIENGPYLAFDGKRSDGSYYTMPNAMPFSMNFEFSKPVLAPFL